MSLTQWKKSTGLGEKNNIAGFLGDIGEKVLIWRMFPSEVGLRIYALCLWRAAVKGGEIADRADGITKK